MIGKLTSIGVLLVMAAGCRGNRSQQQPIHLQLNMDHQKRFEAQEENRYYRDRRAMRPQAKHTIALGELRENKAYFEGLRGAKPTAQLPMRLTKSLLERGKARYEVYCSRCHGLSGNGKGVMTSRKIKIPPTSYMEPRLRQEPIGHIFRVITNGIRNMSGLAAQIPVRDRWAISAYVRALQLAGAASCEELPADVRTKNGWCMQ